MDEFRGKDSAFVSEWLNKKEFLKFVSIFKGMYKNLRVLNW